MANKFGRIPIVPISALDDDKAIRGELLVNWDGLYLMGKNPVTGEVVRLGDADSLLGTVNYIGGTNFDKLTNDFSGTGVEMSLSKGTGWYNSNELVCNYLSIDSSIYVNSQYKIYKNRIYSLSFYAGSNKTTIMHIRFGNSIFDLRIAKSPMSKYRIVIDTSDFENNYYEGFYIEFEDSINIKFSQFMFEYGATSNPWTDRTQITSVKVGDLNINGVLSINGVDIMGIISGNGTQGTSYTPNDITTNPDYIKEQTEDANYDIISVKANKDENIVIASKDFGNLIYGTYSIMLRMKAILDNGYTSAPIATVNVYEVTDETKLLSKSDIYTSDFDNINEFEDLGIITKYTGNKGKVNDKTLRVEVVAHGNGFTTLQIDFIYISLAYTSLLPTVSTQQ